MRSHDMKTQYPLESGNKKATSGAKLCTGTQENRHILKSLCAVDCKRSEHYPDLWNPILAKMKKKKKERCFEGESENSGFIQNKAKGEPP